MSAGAAAAEDAARPRLSVVVMAFNEADNLRAAFGEIHRELRALGRSFEVLIVDDGSSDGTGAIADELASACAGVRAIHHEANRGLGGVYRTGYAQARGELVTFYPADGQFPTDAIPRFAALLDEADMVLGYLPRRRDSWLGRLLSLAERALYAVLFGGMPRFQGVMMFRRALLDGIELKSHGRGWAVVMELILRARRAGRRIVSAPTSVRPRMSGASKVNNLRTIWANLRQVLALRWHL